jgi:RHS repeat-associated protein
VFGRLLLVTRANGETVSYTYLSRSTQSKDENGVIRISQVDGLGRPTIVCEISQNSQMPGSGSPVSCGTDISGTGFVTSYSYSLASPTTTVTQGAQTRTFQTDWLGRPTSVTEPESGTTTYGYAYNSTGLVVTRNKPQANQTSASTLTTTTTQYDSVGRVVSINYSDGTPTKTFAYDASANWSSLTQANLKGRLSIASVPNAASIFSYDAMGRITGLDECLPSGACNSSYDKVQQYTYDFAGDLLSSTDGAGVKSTFTVSPANEVLSLTSSQSNSTNPAGIISGVQNGPNGPLSFGLGNGLSGVYSYDTLGRLNGGWVCSGSTSASCSGGTQTYGFTAGWRGEQLASSFDSVLNQNSSYGYDEFNRLTSRTVNSGTVQNLTWIYDRWGNRTQQTASPSGPQPSYSFNTSSNQITGLNYDAAGNLTKDGTPHGYTYDAEGNITAVDGGQTAQYVYDALNHRVRTVVGGNATEFVYNAAGQRASIWDGSTHAQKQGQYYWGGKPVAYYSGGSTHFQHQDWVGTERMRTGYNASVEGSFTSLPFGDAQTTVAGTDGDSYHFATLDHDSEDNTDHAQFRQYSNTQGRWLSPDPYAGSYDASNPQSFNRYAYVLNNPLALVDRLGLDECSPSPDPIDGGYDGGVGGSDPFCPPAPGGDGGPSGPPEIGVNLPSSGPGNTPGTAIPDNDPVWAETLGMPAGWMPQPQDLASIVQDTLGLPTMADVGCNPICDATNGAQNNFNTAQTLALLHQAYCEATAGPIQGLKNIYNNSTGKYDFGWTPQYRHSTWTLGNVTMNADQMGNFIAGFEGASYDNRFTFGLGNLAQSGVEGAGLYYHLNGQTHAKNDPLDFTGMPDIMKGELFASYIYSGTNCN